VKKVRALCNAYMAPLRERRALPSGELAAVFRSLADIRDVHNKLNGA
jgi:hypothetical protein